MNDKALLALRMMTKTVTEEQNCVLELLIGEEGILAHLIPFEIWEAEMGDDEDD